MNNAEEMQTTNPEEAAINQAFQTLLESYLASRHRKKVDIITKAFHFARQAHKGVRRLSGEPYIMHPIAVAQIVCTEMGLGSTSICSALLHDVVEDTEYTIDDIENLFGEKIAQIVDGLTKIAGGIFGDQASAQAENFKKLLLTMSDDIRVVLIKIADRLHNMRTLSSVQPNKQYKVAGETLYIYAPLANRLGLYKIKSELEDLSFRYEHPDEYELISKRLNLTANERTEIFKEFVAPIRAELDHLKLTYEIKARVKTPFSIWNKIQNKHVAFEDIYDILAVRIIFEPTTPETEFNDCFNIYVALSRIYKTHPDRLRDWVNHPKANGYQALHTTLMSNRGQWIEVQIRSKRMDDLAERGFAAHWKYKDGNVTPNEDGELEKWLYTIKEILDDPQPDTIDLLDTIKLNLFASEIFVFTPKGELKTMPQNATALDFAFSIHTFLGTHCIGAKVNHKLVPLSHILQSGDQVEIITSKSQRVQPSWVNFVSTAKAKMKILALLKKEQRIAQHKGEEMLAQFFRNEQIDLNNALFDSLLRLHNMPSREALMVAIGQGNIVLGEVDRNVLSEKKRTVNNWTRYIFPFAKGQNTKGKAKVQEQPTHTAQISRKKVVTLTEETIQKEYTLATCCKPIPGDDVLGYVDEKGAVFIHQRQCGVAAKLKSSVGNRILTAEWNTHRYLIFPATIVLRGIDGLGVLQKITHILSEQMQVNMHKLSIESNDGIFDSEIELYVHDVTDLITICNNLRSIREVSSVMRK